VQLGCNNCDEGEAAHEFQFIIDPQYENGVLSIYSTQGDNPTHFSTKCTVPVLIDDKIGENSTLKSEIMLYLHCMSNDDNEYPPGPITYFFVYKHTKATLYQCLDAYWNAATFPEISLPLMILIIFGVLFVGF